MNTNNVSKSAWLTVGQLTKIIKKLKAKDGALKFFRKDEVIYHTVTSNGKTGKEVVGQPRKKGSQIGAGAEGLLQSEYYESTNGKTYLVGIIDGKFFSDNNRLTRKIRQEADRRKFITPDAETAPLLWEKFSKKEVKVMGFSKIVVMHNPIIDLKKTPGLLGVSCDDVAFWLSAHYAGLDGWWSKDYGFAFVVSQIK